MYQILIVDDEILVRTNIKMMIDWDGSDFCLCGEAANGVDALSILREKHPEIVFTDMKMPVMDGLALSDEIAKFFSDIALIALSNYDDFEYVRDVLKNGAVDYILKHMESSQIIFTDLFGVISTVCKQYHIKQTSIFSGGNSIPNILSSYDFDKIMLRFELLFEQVISHMPSAEESHYSHYIKAAVDLIYQDYKKNISQQNIADKLGISGSYLSSLFKSETGTGFSEYVADFRLKKAENPFKNGENNIREVAMMCGFYDYYYFFKVFKKKYSMTPNEFIKNYAAG
jgi:two-component system response regulator YesN